MDRIIATLPPVGLSNGKNLSQSKETVSTYSVIVIDPKCDPAGLAAKRQHMRELITVRVYMGRSRNASTVYASIWVNGPLWTSGHGSAGGYGYHKASAAIGDAIRSAGIVLSSDINGCGDSAVESALRAIASSLGFDSCFISSH